MDPIILIFLIIAGVKSVIFGFILYRVFRKDIREWWAEKHQPKVVTRPICLFCQSVWTHPVGQPESRWDGNELTVITTYECEHCHFPNRFVEHFTVGGLSQKKDSSPRAQ